MPPNEETSEGAPNWTFRLFLIFAGLILVFSIGWLIWATVRFGPTSDEDVLRGLLRDKIFDSPDILLTRENSDCRSPGYVRGSISADLFVSFTEANSDVPPDPVDLIGLNPRQRVVDASQKPSEWYRSEGTPVASISNIGINQRDALVCIDVYAREAASYFVKLYRRSPKHWEVVEEIVVWKEEPPEEIPESRIPEVSY